MGRSVARGSAIGATDPSPRDNEQRLGFWGRWATDRLLGRLVGPLDDEGRRAVSPERFGIRVQDAVCRERIRAILEAFFGGFECAIKTPGRLAPGAAELGALLRPFYSEGAAMGFGARNLLRLRGTSFTLRRFERLAIPPDDPFVFLRYVGLGFWLGFRFSKRAGRVERAAERLRARGMRHLVHDGYGFQTGFFSLPRSAGAPERLRTLPGFSRVSAFNGLGRSLWFFWMDRPREGVEYTASFGEDRDAVLGGMGLAAGFTFPDDLSRAYGVADGLDPELRRHFQKGIRIALYVRRRNDPDYLEQCVGALPAQLAERARRDLALALKTGEATQESDEFIDEFHRGCVST